MSEKRFLYRNFLEDIVDTCNKLWEQVVKLREENEQLKKECKIAIDEMVTDYKKLEKENEQLINKLEVANARSSYYQRMLKKWCVK